MPRKNPTPSSPRQPHFWIGGAETTETEVENFVFPVFLEKNALLRKMSRDKQIIYIKFPIK